MIEKDDNISIVNTMTVDAEVTRQCQATYKSPADVALCQRVAMAGKTVAFFIASKTETPNVQFTTPDRNRVSKTLEEYPEPQCRLDTYFQGTLCDKPFTDNVSKDDTSIGTCTARSGFSIGLRPACWYRASQNDI